MDLKLDDVEDARTCPFGKQAASRRLDVASVVAKRTSLQKASYHIVTDQMANKLVSPSPKSVLWRASPSCFSPFWPFIIHYVFSFMMFMNASKRALLQVTCASDCRPFHCAVPP